MVPEGAWLPDAHEAAASRTRREQPVTGEGGGVAEGEERGETAERFCRGKRPAEPHASRSVEPPNQAVKSKGRLVRKGRARTNLARNVTAWPTS
jgi:hypothetical protein